MPGPGKCQNYIWLGLLKKNGNCFDDISDCSTSYYIYAEGEEESIGKYSVSNGTANPLLPLSAHILHDEKKG
jgi:hypothetical protein